MSVCVCVCVHILYLYPMMLNRCLPSGLSHTFNGNRVCDSAHPPDWRINFCPLTSCENQTFWRTGKLQTQKQEEWLKVNLQLCSRCCQLAAEAGGLGGASSAPFCSSLSFRWSCARPLILHTPSLSFRSLVPTFWNTLKQTFVGMKCNINLSKSDGPAWGKNVKSSQEPVGQNCRRRLQGWFRPTGAGAFDPNMDLH